MTKARSRQEDDCLRQGFASIPLPAYVAPGARPPMGRHNDRIYEMQQALLQAELDGLAERAGLAAALRALYDQQVDIGFIQDDLSQVGYFRPRNRFYTRSPGLEGMVAGLETLGEFILCTEEEHRAIREQRVNYDYLWRIQEAVCPPEEIAL